MKGKIGLIVGLGAGYVLGTRAGRERYEQIKTQWLKVWNMDPVQEQVDKVRDFVGDKAAAVPGAVWNGAVKVVKSVSGSGTPGQKLDSAIASGKEAVETVANATEDAVDEAKERSKGSGSSTMKPAKPVGSETDAKKNTSAGS